MLHRARWVLAVLAAVVLPQCGGEDDTQGGGGSGGTTLPPGCGDGICSSDEDCASCSEDCGPCSATCGDGSCDGDEDCSSCVADCGACPPPDCGDGSCEVGETCANCADDCGACPSGKNLGDQGSHKKWAKIEIDFDGPTADGTSDTNNPFAVTVHVTFDGPNGATMTVPAFFAGDGDGGQSGSVWRVRFSADRVGSWGFATMSTDDAALDGYHGSFEVIDIDGSEPGCYRLGRLSHVDDRYYLQFAEGPFWLKGGADDPENFLGAPFGDGTMAFKQAKIDYLASKGVNAQYLMTHNLEGDLRDSWPWLGATEAEAKTNHRLFDVGKLREWEELFVYMQERGVVPHVVLEDDSAWTGYDHDLYYRELVARFAHHPALIWNLGEEFNENYSTAEVRGFAAQLSATDAYDHPVTVHGTGVGTWDPLFGEADFDLTSLQHQGATALASASLPDFNQLTVDLRQAAATAGRVIPISFDETPRATDASESTRDKLRTGVVWPIYMAGGNFELHYRVDDVDYEDLDAFWADMTLAREFIEQAPFADMAPDNSLVSAGLCLAQADQAYLIYLDPCTASVDLDLGAGTYDVSWYDPETGSSAAAADVVGPGTETLSRPGSISSSDCAVAVLAQ
jgi:hypothetical protein